MTLAVWLMVSALLVSEPESSSAPTTMVDFDSQIVPLLTHAGCNAGACHGAAAGRGGFHLSLFGSDPKSDYEAIVLFAEGRRVNIVDDTKSLVIAKPLGLLDTEAARCLRRDQRVFWFCGVGSSRVQSEGHNGSSGN